MMMDLRWKRNLQCLARMRHVEERKDDGQDEWTGLRREKRSKLILFSLLKDI